MMVVWIVMKGVVMSTIKGKNINHPNHTENLNSEKYAIIREAILHVLPLGSSMSFEDLETDVEAYIAEKQVPKEMFPKPGSIRCPSFVSQPSCHLLSRKLGVSC